MRTKQSALLWITLVLIISSLSACAAEIPVEVNVNKDQSTFIVDYYTMESENLANHILLDKAKIRVFNGEFYYLDVYGSLWQWNIAPTSFPKIVKTGVVDFINQSTYLDTQGNLWHGGQILLANIIQLASDNSTHLFIDSNHDLWVWGVAFVDGQGNFSKNELNIETPVKIDDDVAEVQNGVYSHQSGVIILKNDGSVYEWGVLTRDENLIKKPRLLNINGKHIIRVNDALYVLDQENDLWLVEEKYPYMVDTPRPYVVFSKVSNVVASPCGQIISYRDGSRNGLRWSISDASNEYCMVQGLGKRTDIADYRTQDNLSMVLYRDDTLRIFGSSYYVDPDGVGSYREIIPHFIVPELFVYRENYPVKSFRINDDHALLLMQDNSLWSKGNNDSGQLGNGTLLDKTRIYKILDQVIAMDLNQKQSFAIRSDQTLWAWGENSDYSLDSTGVDILLPKQIMDGVLAMDIGDGYYAVVKNDNGLYVKGNLHGQSYSTYTKIADDVAFVSTLGENTLFIKTDSTLWTLGLNQNGECATGNKSPQPVPVQIASHVIDARMNTNGVTYIDQDHALWGSGYKRKGRNQVVLTPFLIDSEVTALGAYIEDQTQYIYAKNNRLMQFDNQRDYYHEIYTYIKLENVLQFERDGTMPMILLSSGEILYYKWNNLLPFGY
jgi:alpha-tubulin suppressor-like RCC1 family protein